MPRRILNKIARYWSKSRPSSQYLAAVIAWRLCGGPPSSGHVVVARCWWLLSWSVYFIQYLNHMIMADRRTGHSGRDFVVRTIAVMAGVRRSVACGHYAWGQCPLGHFGILILVPSGIQWYSLLKSVKQEFGSKTCGFDTNRCGQRRHELYSHAISNAKMCIPI
jgi:hypothetical protein